MGIAVNSGIETAMLVTKRTNCGSHTLTIDRDWVFLDHRQISDGVYGCAQFVRYLYLDGNVVGRILQAESFELQAAVLPSRREFWSMGAYLTSADAFAAAMRTWT